MVRAALGLSLVIGAACACPTSSSEAREVSPSAVERAFYEAAAAGNWYLVGRVQFRRVARDFPAELWPADPDAKSASKLLEGHGFYSLDVAPDGERFAALTKRFGADIREDPHLVIFNRELEVVYEDPRETNVGQKGERTRSALRWSPDGTALAYAQSGEVWLIDPAGGQRRAVAHDHQMKLSFTAPSWGPDRQLAYENERKQVAIVNVDSGELRTLGPGRFPSWSPDGATIVYRKDSGEVYAHDLSSGSETELFSLRLHHPNYLWTPDSRYVLVDQRIHNSRYKNYYLYAFGDGELVDLRTKSDALEDLLIEELPPWLGAHLVPLEGP